MGYKQTGDTTEGKESVEETGVDQSAAMKNCKNYWKTGDNLLDEFIVDRKLGEGGMGTVYLVNRSLDKQPFALKTLRLSRANISGINQQMLRELRIWIDLPKNPHITDFHFFRTIGNRRGLFSEYVDGGSLQDLITRKEPVDLKQIFDWAIQLAWGIHAAHVNGVVHKDIKPGNILLAKDGTLKLTDFGISNIRLSLEKFPGKETSGFSSSSMTTAYCSPEQADYEKITYRTDIWSYGLSILTLFTGPATWLYGTIAVDLLDAVKENKKINDGPELPQKLYDILKKCFQKNPLARWDSMLLTANKLIEVYSEEFGEEYSRETPKFTIRSGGKELTRTDFFGNTWLSPAEFVTNSYFHIIPDVPDISEVSKESSMGLRTQAIMELQWFEQILVKCLDLSSEKLEVKILTSHAYNYIGSILAYLEDRIGAITCFDKAIDLLTSINELKTQDSLVYILSSVYQRKANTLTALNHIDDALIFYDRQINLLQELLNGNSLDSMTLRFLDNYSTANSSKGIAHFRRNEFSHAVKNFSLLVEINEFKAKLSSDDKPTTDMVLAYMNLGNAYGGTHNHSAGLKAYEKAVELIEQIPFEDVKFLKSRILIYLNLSTKYSGSKTPEKGLPLINKSIEAAEYLVHDLGHVEHRELMCHVILIKAILLSQADRDQEAEKLYKAALKNYKILVFEEGCTHYTYEMCQVYANLAIFSDKQENYQDMFKYIDLAVTHIEHFMTTRDRLMLKMYHLNWKAYRSLAVFKSGDVKKAKIQATELRENAMKLFNEPGTENFSGTKESTLYCLDLILNEE